MRLIKKKTLTEFGQKYAGARDALNLMASIIENAAWASMDDIIRTMSQKPSPIGSDRVVFNICGNRFRLICALRFNPKFPKKGLVFVKWFGTHAAYDKVDAATVTL